MWSKLGKFLRLSRMWCHICQLCGDHVSWLSPKCRGKKDPKSICAKHPGAIHEQEWIWCWCEK